MLKRIYSSPNLADLAFAALRHLPTPLLRPLAGHLVGKFSREAASLDFPHRITFFVTNRCNMRCRHCFYAGEISRRGDEMFLEDIQQLARSLRGKARQIILTGGEPFVREDLVEICVAFERHSEIGSVTIMTNGLLSEQTERKVQAILEQTKLVLNFQISIDGPAEYHDAIRAVPGAFDRAVDTIRRLSKLPQRGRIGRLITATCISKANLATLEETIRILRQMEEVQPGFMFVRGTSKSVHGIRDASLLNDFDPSDDDLWLTDQEMREALEILDRTLWQVTRPTLFSALNRLTLESVAEYFSTGVRCMAGIVDVVIYPGGDVALCEMTKPFANLQDYSFDLAELWKQEYSPHARKLYGCQCTHDCNVSSMVKFDKERFFRLFISNWEGNGNTR